MEHGKLKKQKILRVRAVIPNEKMLKRKKIQRLRSELSDLEAGLEVLYKKQKLDKTEDTAAELKTLRSDIRGVKNKIKAVRELT